MSASNDDLLGQAEMSDDPLVQELARRLGWALVHWQELARDADAAIAAKRGQGGQHAGVPRLVTAAPSLLQRLHYDARAAMMTPPETATLEALRQALAQR